MDALVLGEVDGAAVGDGHQGGQLPSLPGSERPTGATQDQGEVGPGQGRPGHVVRSLVTEVGRRRPAVAGHEGGQPRAGRRRAHDRHGHPGGSPRQHHGPVRLEVATSMVGQHVQQALHARLLQEKGGRLQGVDAGVEVAVPQEVDFLHVDTFDLAHLVEQ